MTFRTAEDFLKEELREGEKMHGEYLQPYRHEHQEERLGAEGRLGRNKWDGERNGHEREQKSKNKLYKKLL